MALGCRFGMRGYLYSRLETALRDEFRNPTLSCRLKREDEFLDNTGTGVSPVNHEQDARATGGTVGPATSPFHVSVSPGPLPGRSLVRRSHLCALVESQARRTNGCLT